MSCPAKFLVCFKRAAAGLRLVRDRDALEAQYPILLDTRRLQEAGQWRAFQVRMQGDALWRREFIPLFWSRRIRADGAIVDVD